MKGIYLYILFLMAFSVNGQKIDNYSFIKLYLTNEKSQVLLVKYDGQWEIAGDRYNETVSIREFVNGIANDMGVIIGNVQLCGLFTQKWQGKSPLTLMQYYKANFIRGDLKVPADCTDIKWFSFDEAIKIIPYSIMTSMMQQIKKYPSKVIGAAFERYKDANNVSQYRTIEDFYIMN